MRPRWRWPSRRPLSDAAPRILRAICESLGWDHGAVWEVMPGANFLKCVQTWRAPGLNLDNFDEVCKTLKFAPGIGLPGRVWESGKPTWIEDVVEDANFPRAKIARAEGLHGALGFPIVLGGDVLGVIEFFSREIQKPDEPLLEMLGTVGSQIGQFIERKRAEDELDKFFTLSLDLLCVAGTDGYFKRVNPAWQRTLGFTCEEMLARPWSDFIHKDDRAASAEAAAGLEKGNDPRLLREPILLQGRLVPLDPLDRDLRPARTADLRDRSRRDRAQARAGGAGGERPAPPPARQGARRRAATAPKTPRG
jgi:PAS domain S-box-containing protein